MKITVHATYSPHITMQLNRDVGDTSCLHWCQLCLPNDQTEAKGKEKELWIKEYFRKRLPLCSICHAIVIFCSRILQEWQRKTDFLLEKPDHTFLKIVQEAAIAEIRLDITLRFLAAGDSCLSELFA